MSTIFQSRKFWVGTIGAACSIIGGVGLLMGKLTPAGYAVFVSGTAGPAIALIMGIAWEDSAQKQGMVSQPGSVLAPVTISSKEVSK